MSREELKKDFILLNVGHARHNANWNWRNVQSPFIRIHYVKQGTAKIIREDGAYDLKKGYLYLTPSYIKHSYENDGILELYYIHIYEDTGNSLSIFDLINFPVEIEASPLDIHLMERLIEINPERELKYYDPSSYDSSTTVAYNVARQQNTPLAFELETQGILKQIISHFLTQADYKHKQTEERILKALHFIHQNIDTQIMLEELSENCHMTKDHFIRLFKKEMHCTPGKYINQKKIENAQLRILISKASIKDIAYGLGFENISYFNKLFTKITGESPGKYRKEFSQT